MSLLSDALFYVPYVIGMWALIGVVAWAVIRLFYPEFPKVSFFSSILSGPVLAAELSIAIQVLWVLKHIKPVDGNESKGEDF